MGPGSVVSGTGAKWGMSYHLFGSCPVAHTGCGPSNSHQCNIFSPIGLQRCCMQRKAHCKLPTCLPGALSMTSTSRAGPRMVVGLAGSIRARSASEGRPRTIAETFWGEGGREGRGWCHRVAIEMQTKGPVRFSALAWPSKTAAALKRRPPRPQPCGPPKRHRAALHALGPLRGSALPTFPNG
jgi:hypothetical protein